MRIKAGGVIELDGETITSWDDVSGTATDQTARDAAAAASNAAAAAQATATYGSNTANTALANAATAQSAAEAADAKAVTADGIADTALAVADGLNSRSNAWDKAIYTPGAQQISDNATTVLVAQAVARIGGSVAVTFADCEKQIADGTDGQFLTVICTNASVNAIKFSDGQGVKLAETVSFSMSANDVIQFVYDGANWVEVHRTDN